MKEEKNRGRAWMLRREKASRMLATACASHRDLGYSGGDGAASTDCPVRTYKATDGSDSRPQFFD